MKLTDQIINEAEQTMAAERAEKAALAAEFFTHGPDDVAGAPVIAATPKKTRKSRKGEPELLALKRFVRAMEMADPHKRDANIKYLADRFLGVKLWPW